MQLVVLDNKDSFTYMLVDFLQQCGADCRVVRNDASPAEIATGEVDGLVLSPGPGTPEQAGCLMSVIERYYQHVPILGVCLGHQALGQFFGASLTRGLRPMHGKISEIEVLEDDVLFRGLPQRFTVTRYHSLVLRDLPHTLRSLAETEEGEIMALRHQQYPIWGVQFHPEAALTQNGLALLENWINFVRFSTFHTKSSLLSTAP